MPLPLIPLLLGGGAILTGLAGAGGMISGKEKIDEAKHRISRAKDKYENKKRSLETTQKSSMSVLDELGKTRLEIQQSFSRFADAVERIKNRPEFREVGRERFRFTSVDLRNVRQVSVNAGEIIASLTGSMLTGGGIAWGTYGLIGLLGHASTGTAIAGLSGAALKSATLAWLGGGSLAAGGLGMAGGAAVLGGLVVAPALLFMGFSADSKGDDALAQARKAEKEVDSATGKMDRIITFFNNIAELSRTLLYELKKAQSFYDYKVSQLEALVNRCDNYRYFSEDDKLLLDNNIMLVKILSEMTQIDLLCKNEKGEPVMENSAIRRIEVLSLVDKSEATLREIAA